MTGMFVQKPEETIICGLIRGRHEMPVDTYIFDDAITDVMDFHAIGKHIHDFIVDNVGIISTIGSGINQFDFTDIQIFSGRRKLVVYVTGLTAVTAELIKICAMNGIHLTLMHYNSVTGEYVAQPIFF